MARRLAALFALLFALLAGCKERPPKVPGESDIEVASLEIVPVQGTSLALAHGELFERLGQRPESLIATGRWWSPFREAEDRRRIEAYWQQRGYFDVVVKQRAQRHAQWKRVLDARREIDR